MILAPEASGSYDFKRESSKIFVGRHPRLGPLKHCLGDRAGSGDKTLAVDRRSGRPARRFLLDVSLCGSLSEVSLAP